VARRTNFCEEPDGLAFRLSDAGVVWDASQPIDPHDPLGKLAGCKQCLEELMSQGETPASQVFRQGGECGFTPKEMRAAATRLKVSSTRVGYGGEGHWVWTYGEERPLPNSPPTGRENARQSTAATPTRATLRQRSPSPLGEGRGEGRASLENDPTPTLRQRGGRNAAGRRSAPAASGGPGTGDAQPVLKGADLPVVDHPVPASARINAIACRSMRARLMCRTTKIFGIFDKTAEIVKGVHIVGPVVDPSRDSGSSFFCP